MMGTNQVSEASKMSPSFLGERKALEFGVLRARPLQHALEKMELRLARRAEIERFEFARLFDKLIKPAWRFKSRKRQMSDKIALLRGDAQRDEGSFDIAREFREMGRGFDSAPADAGAPL